MQSRAGTRIEAHAEVRAERDADRGQDLKARLNLVAFDAREMRLVDSDDVRELRQRHPRVQAKATYVLSALETEPSDSPCGLAGDFGA
jgi:hypothetical protein